MSKIIGIDLGTTFSAAAVVNQFGKPELLHNRDGETLTPSVVLFQDEFVLVGTMAKRSAATAPLDVVEFVKRHMGSRSWRFEASNGTKFSPEEISAIILRRISEYAETAFGNQKVSRAVITVPAYFDDARRRATMDAGKIAGLDVVRVLNEPTAAALAFGLKSGRSGTFLVYDLGGGTFDVTLLRINEGDYDVIATDGLHELGGVDWDNCLMEWLNQEFQGQGGRDLTELFELDAELREKAEIAKRSLSQSPMTRVVLGAEGISKILTVTRDTFELLTTSLLNRSRDLTVSLVEESGLTWSDIDDILLVGGSTRMPMVVRMLEEMAGRPPLRAGNPDELVALGAAVQAQLEENKTGKEVVPFQQPLNVRDVTSQSVGVLALDDRQVVRNHIVLASNTKVPCKQISGEFRTVVDNQTEILVEVTQGDSEDPQYVKQIGQREIPIPPYPAGAPIRISLDYDLDQILHIEVTDLTTTRSLGNFEIQNFANLSRSEVAAAHQKIQSLGVQ